MRSIGTVIAIAAIAAAASAQAAEQAYPTRPVRLVVALAAGGPTDVVMRLVAARLSEQLGRQVVVDNRPAAGGGVAGEIVANAPPDGYTLFAGANGTIAIAPSLFARLPFSVSRDLTPVALVGNSPLAVMVHPAVPAQSMKELLALAKAKPGTVTYGSPGSGSVPHLATELFKLRTGADLTHVPYKGGGPAVADLLAGHISMMFASPIEVSSHVAAGKLKYLVTSTTQRVGSLPDIPSANDVGVSDFNVVAWFGLVAHASTPKEVIARLSPEIGRILAAPDVRERFAAQGAEITYMPAEAFDAFLSREREQWAQAVKASGAKLD